MNMEKEAINSTDNLLKEVEKLNNNTPNGAIHDADTILADIMCDCDWEISGLATDIFETYKNAHDKQAVKDVFYTLTGKEFNEFLKICTEHITKHNAPREILTALEKAGVHIEPLPQDGVKTDKYSITPVKPNLDNLVENIRETIVADGYDDDTKNEMIKDMLKNAGL